MKRRLISAGLARLVRRTHLLALTGLALVATTLAATDVGAQTEAPWVAGPLQASPSSMLRAAEVALLNARNVTAGAGAVVLFHDASYTYDATGRAVFRRHWVYRVLDASSVAEWSELELRWSPWHQALPTIQARVISADGAVAELSESNIEEKAERRGRPGDRPAGRADPDRRRWLLARLPAVATGSLVEVVTEVRDLGPAFDAGITQRHYFVMFVPVLDSRFTLDVSKRLPLRYLVRKPHGLLSVREPISKPTVSQTADRFRLELRAQNLSAAGAVAEGLSGHVPRYAHVAFSTGRDWQRVAARYQHLVERVLHPDLAALDRDFGDRIETAAVSSPAGRGARGRVDAVLDAVRARVRHDGSELEASPPGPRHLSRILALGEGNAVDLATLTVAALRRVGIRSHAALLDAGFAMDAEAGLPGLGLFNHVVVHVPKQLAAGQPLEELWIDPGAPFARAGELPLVDQGRSALVAARDTTDLVQLPTTTPDDNLAFEEREIFLRDWGPGDLVESSRYSGSAEQTQRAVTGGLDDAARRRGYLAYARAFHGAAGLGAIEESTAHDLSEEFRLCLEIEGAASAVTDLDRATVRIPVAELGRRLPQVFRATLDTRRRHEFVFHEPFATAWSYVIHPPLGFVAGDLPPDEALDLGPGVYRHSFHADRSETGGEVIRGTLHFSVGQRRLTADQFERMHAALVEFLERPPLDVEMVPVAERAEDPVQRAQWLAAAVARNPGGAAHRVRLVPALLDLGLVAEARRQARQVMDLAPGWQLGPWALGLALSYDDLGRFAGPGHDLSPARDQLRIARRLMPEDPRADRTLARLDQAEVSGGQGTDDADLVAPDAGTGSDITSGATSQDGASAETSPPADESTRPMSWTPPPGFDVASLHPEDPKTPLYRLLLALHRSEPLHDALHPRERLRLRRDGTADYLSRLRAVDRPADVEVDGAPHLGYRLDLEPGGGVGKLYVTQLAGDLQVAAVDSAPSALGREAIDRVWEGDLTGAVRWMDWIHEELKRSADPETAPFRDLWPTRKPEEVTAEEIRLAAAALAARADLDGRGIEFLEAAVDRAEGIAPYGRGYTDSQAQQRRRAATVSLVEALLAAGREQEAATRLERLAAEGRTGGRLRELEVELRVALEDWGGVDELVEARPTSDDGDESASELRARAALLAARGEYGDAAGIWQTLQRQGELTDDDASRWTEMLLQPTVPAASSDLRALGEHVRRAVSPELLRRVAALFADFGREKDARELTLRAAGSEPYRPTPADLFVQARVAESVGLVDAARRTYAELVATTGPASGQDERDAALFRQLAQARLARLSFD